MFIFAFVFVFVFAFAFVVMRVSLSIYTGMIYPYSAASIEFGVSSEASGGSVDMRYYTCDATSSQTEAWKSGCVSVPVRQCSLASVSQ
jgi:hypothetical protein